MNRNGLYNTRMNQNCVVLTLASFWVLKVNVDVTRIF